MTYTTGNIVLLKHTWRSPILLGLLIVALSLGEVRGFRKISFGGSRTQARCAARGEYCTTNEQCCGSQSGVECMTLSGIGQCLSDRDRAMVFESPCETTDDCTAGYCCVIPAGYRRTRVRRCKPRRAEDTRCLDETDESYYHGYVRVGKGKRLMDGNAYSRHTYSY